MIGFQDFAPKETKPSGLFSGAEYEPLDKALEAANQWINEHDVNVTRIETVVLPNIHKTYEEGTEDSELRASGEYVTSWYQFFRVWYRY